LIDTGTPCSAPSFTPRLPTIAVARRAAASAGSAATVQYALSPGFTFSIRPRTARITSNGETFLRRIIETSSDARAKQSSSSLIEDP
jgi:hypothetical protein